MDYNKQLDYSSLSTYLDCPRKFMFQYMFHLRNNKPNIDLIFGSAWHYGLEVTYQTLKNQGTKLTTLECKNLSIQAFNAYWAVTGATHWPNPDSIFPKNPGHASNMYDKYWDTYWVEDNQYKIIGVEIPFNLDLPNQTTQYIGRMDLVLINPTKDQLLIIDHKTASMITKITLSSFQSSLQTDGYLTIGKLYYDKLPQMVYNIAVCQKTKITFDRMIVMKRDQSTNRFISDLNHHMNKIKQDINLMQEEKTAQHNTLTDVTYNPIAFKRNPGYACTQYFRNCPYFDLCLYRNNPYLWDNPCNTPAGYIMDEWNPNTHDEKIKTLITQNKGA